MMHVRTCPAVAVPSAHDAGGFCPRFQYAVELIGRRWVGAILRLLGGGPRRFNEIASAVPGLSDRLLSERLRELEDVGLIARTVDPGERPPRITYALTTSGESLDHVIDAIGTWAERWVETPG